MGMKNPASQPLSGAGFKKLRTKDLHLTAFLSARGAKLMGVARDGRVVWFTLSAEDIPELVQDFHGNGTVKILDFVGNLRNLKSIIFDDAGTFSEGEGKRI